MSKWIELQHREGNIIIDFEKVFEIYIEVRHRNTKNESWYVVLLIIDKNDKSYINCKSELEAQMIYAKLKKFLTNSEGLKEIEL